MRPSISLGPILIRIPHFKFFKEIAIPLCWYPLLSLMLLTILRFCRETVHTETNSCNRNICLSLNRESTVFNSKTAIINFDGNSVGQVNKERKSTSESPVLRSTQCSRVHVLVRPLDKFMFSNNRFCRTSEKRGIVCSRTVRVRIF